MRTVVVRLGSIGGLIGFEAFESESSEERAYSY